MPVWKSSYRLVLDNGTAKKPLLEGWAIIDNTTSEDWTNVNLSVISGRPISFISNLYQPKFIERAVAELDEDRAVAPPVYKSRMSAPQMRALQEAPNAGIAGGVVGGFLGPEALQERVIVSSSVAVDTQAKEAGELFEYKFSKPVTVKRNESAMLPFVQQDIDARKLLIYTENSQRENPLNSAELTNSTGKTLDGGPLSVYDGGVYAGEALVNTFKAGDKRLLSYALDLGTRVVEDANNSPRVLREVKVSRGILTQRLVMNVTKTYNIANVDKKPKTLIIEHLKQHDRTLVGAKAAEETKTHYRFEVKLTGEAAQSLTVKQEQTLLENLNLSSTSDSQLVSILANAAISAEAKRALEPLIQLRRQIAESNVTIKNLNDQAREAEADQNRLRQNLSSMNSVAGQQERVQKYASDLGKLDDRILNLRDQLTAETKKRDDLNRQLSQRIESLAL